MNPEENKTKSEKSTSAKKKRAIAIKLHAKELFDRSMSEYIAFFLQNRSMSPDERTSSVIALAEKSIEYADIFNSAWTRKRGKFLAD